MATRMVLVHCRHAETMPQRAPPAGLVRSIGGASLGCALLLVFEYAVFAARQLQALSFADHGAIVLCAAMAGCVAGLLAALPGALLAHLVGRRRSPRALAGAVAGAAAAASLVDAVAYVNLYPDAHQLLGLGALALAATAGVVLAPPRHARVLALAALACALAAVLTVPSLIGDSQSRRHATIAHMPIFGRLVSLWPAPAPSSEGSETACAWPAARAVTPTSIAAGSSVLLITIDAFRGDLGGPALASTLPKTTAQLQGAFRFDRAYAPAPRTTYSTYAMLTGRAPHRLGFVAASTDVNDKFTRLADDDPIMIDPTKWKLRHRYPLGDTTPTLPGIVSALGYQTRAIVADVGLLPAAGITREFDDVDDSPYQRNGRRDEGGNSSSPSTDAAIAFLEQAPAGPVLAWIHYRDPHHPYDAYPPTPANAPTGARYLSEFKRVDDQIDRLLSSLQASSRASSTIVIVTGDHGEEFRDHGGLFHGTTVYEELIRVPLLMRVPGLGGGVVATPVSLIDLVPTLVDILGVDSNIEFDGASLAPLLADTTASSGRPVLTFNTSYTADNARQAAVIVDSLKLIVDEANGTVELYDLDTDPRERSNLADARPADTQRMRCLFDAAAVF